MRLAIIARFRKDRSGVAATQYALIIVGICIALFSAAGSFGQAVVGLWAKLVTGLTGVIGN